MKLLTLFLSGCLMIAGTGCGAPSGRDVSSGAEAGVPAAAQEGKPAYDFHTFYIYQDAGARNNHFTPSGFMPDGRCVRLDEKHVQNCFSGESCIKISYDVECSRKADRWAGIYWLNPPNNWGKRKGGYNLTGATQLTFYARGERGGEQIQEFTIGGITGDYPDSDMIIMGPVILSKNWKQYTIDLRGKDLSYISGGFAWTTNVDSNNQAVNFYLDDIKFE